MPAVDLPTVSVVVATRDRPELLRRALDAILAQTYEGEVEVVVVFDQSAADAGLEHDAPRRRVRVTNNLRTPGLAGARNHGASVATGELLAFCDDDDEWLAGKLAAQVDVLRSSPDTDVVATGVYINYEDRRIARVPRAADLELRELVRRRVMEAHPSSIVVRRDAFFDRIGPVDEQIPGSYGEDYDWMLRAARAGRIAVVEEPLVDVRWHTASFFADRWQTIIDAIDYGISKHPEFREEPRGLARLYGRRSFALAALGRRGEARRWALRTIRLNPRERRAYIALLISLRLLSPETALRLAHATGRGI